MNKASDINFGRFAFVLLIGGSLLYSFIISGYLEEETRRVVDISIEYGFYAGYCPIFSRSTVLHAANMPEARG